MEIKTERLPVKKKKQAGKIRRRVLRPPKQIPAILNDIIEKLAKQRERWLEANKPPAQLAHVFGEPEEQWNAEKHRTTWNFVFWGDSVVPKDHTTWRDYVGAAFGGNARRHIDQLERLALEGNPDAIKAFAVLTHKMVTT